MSVFENIEVVQLDPVPNRRDRDQLLLLDLVFYFSNLFILLCHVVKYGYRLIPKLRDELKGFAVTSDYFVIFIHN